MSVQATTWVWDHSRAENAGLLVMLAIADAANREGAASMQSIPTLARMCHISERHVARCIVKLIEMGELEKTGQSQRYGTTVYRLPGMGPDPRYPTPDLDVTPDNLSTPDPGDRGPLTSESSTPDPQVTQPQRTPQEDDPTSSSPGGDGGGQQQPTAEQAVDAAFDLWWDQYPRKVARKDAKKAYEKALKAGVSAHDLTAGLRAHLPGWEALKAAEGVGKIPHPATWLNGGRWEDRPDGPEQKDSEPSDDPTAWMKRRIE